MPTDIQSVVEREKSLTPESGRSSMYVFFGTLARTHFTAADNTGGATAVYCQPMLSHLASVSNTAARARVRL
jgi:hypothetical protein